MKQEDQKIGQSESCSDKGGPPTDDDSFRPCTIRFGATGERSNARIPNRSAVKPAAAGGGDQIGQALRGDVMSIIVQGCYYTVYPPAPQLGELRHPGVPMARSCKPCYQSPGRHSPRCQGRLPRHERGLIKAGRPLNLAAARCDQRDSSANPRWRRERDRRVHPGAVAPRMGAPPPRRSNRRPRAIPADATRGLSEWYSC